MLLDTHTPIDQIVLRLLAAVALAMVIGLEREWSNKPAGLRTHMLVSLGSAAFLIVALELVFGELGTAEEAQLDPMRIISGIIGGIGFLGAGCIIQSRGDVQGITTGASVWMAGSIGVACGAGYYVIAAFLAILVVIILAAIGWLERKFIDRRRRRRSEEL